MKSLSFLELKIDMGSSDDDYQSEEEEEEEHQLVEDDEQPVCVMPQFE